MVIKNREVLYKWTIYHFQWLATAPNHDQHILEDILHGLKWNWNGLQNPSSFTAHCSPLTFNPQKLLSGTKAVPLCPWHASCFWSHNTMLSTVQMDTNYSWLCVIKCVLTVVTDDATCWYVCIPNRNSLPTILSIFFAVEWANGAVIYFFRHSLYLKIIFFF